MGVVVGGAMGGVGAAGAMFLWWQNFGRLKTHKMAIIVGRKKRAMMVAPMAPDMMRCFRGQSSVLEEGSLPGEHVQQAVELSARSLQ